MIENVGVWARDTVLTFAGLSVIMPIAFLASTTFIPRNIVIDLGYEASEYLDLGISEIEFNLSSHLLLAFITTVWIGLSYQKHRLS
jgi:hypothetical protein